MLLGPGADIGNGKLLLPVKSMFGCLDIALVINAGLLISTAKNDIVQL